MKRKTGCFLLVMGWGMLLCLSACEWTVTGSERTAVLSFSDAMTDNLLAGLAGNDYQMFSRDFDDDMLEVVPASRFTRLKAELADKVGDCSARVVERVSRADEFYVVTYRFECSKAASVAVGIAYHAVEPHTISHLSFDMEGFSWSSE